MNIKVEEAEKQNIQESNNIIKEQRIDSKISKIKSVFTPKILELNPDITEKLNSLD